MISSVIAIQKLDSQGNWTEFLVAPYRYNELYPDILLNYDDARQLGGL